MRQVREVNSLQKNWQRVDLKIALIFPNRYPVAMANLAFQELYLYFNSFPNVACERVIFTSHSDLPLSLESRQPLTKFDLCGVSLQFELDYLNFLNMLKQSQIPLEAKKRPAASPLICAGGPCCGNPLPFSEVLDFFVIGDLEPIANDMVQCLLESNEKASILENLSQLPGIYIPALPRAQIQANKMKPLDSCFHPTQQVIPDLAANDPIMPVFGKTLLVEVSRGCPWKCRFCLIGYQANPPRQRSLSKIREIIGRGLEESQVDHVSFIGAALSDHPDLCELCWFVLNEGKTFTLPSLRANCITSDLAEALKECQRSVTLAPETGSDSLLAKINKGFQREIVLSAADILMANDISRLKLYFIYGLPSETQDDLAATASLVQKVSALGYRPQRLKVGLNPWIPKAHTPFQWIPQPPLDELRLKLNLLKKKMKFVSVEHLDPRWARIQRLISMGDHALHSVFLNLLPKGLGLGAWRSALRSANMSFESVKFSPADPLPWDFIDVGFSKPHLLAQYEKHRE